jgi:phenylpropionate dioxygenase-like ring-hydroxylating dioxygenase large terminal subunit
MAIDTRTLDPEGALADRLEQGWTLPAHWYGDEDVLQRERDRVFRGSWQYAGPAERVSEPGQYVTCTAGHVPIVAVRDRDGTLRGFVNVCRHRGHVVVQGEGRRATLQCPYHAWTYGLDGCLRSAPRSDRESAFDASELSLLPAQAELWGPLLFVNPDPAAAPFAETYPELGMVVERSGVDVSSLEFHTRREWETSVNWKIAVENYLECYHCPVAHRDFSRVVDVDPDRYGLQSFERFASQLAPVQDGEVRQSQFHWLWPATGLNIYPGHINLGVMTWLPSSPRQTRGYTDYFFARGAPEEAARELIAFSRQVGEEDLALVESVQRGLDSGMVPHGRLLEDSEHLIQHFQRLLYDAIA